MGHSLAAAALETADPVRKVSIIPRSIGALGNTMQRPTDDRCLITGRELKERMVVLTAGRADEELIFGEISTGEAALAKATDIARNGDDPSKFARHRWQSFSPLIGSQPRRILRRDWGGKATVGFWCRSGE
jgi:hypothetical protein